MKNSVFGGLVGAILVCLGAVVGCGQIDAPPVSFGCGCVESPSAPPETNGSRLRPYQVVASDGTTARVHDRYYDESLGVSCSFVAPTSDSMTRYCLPDDTAWLYGGYYNDAQCTVPVAFVAQCGAVPRYVKSSKENGCFAELMAFYEVVGLSEKPDSIFWNSPDGGCINQGNPATNSVVVLIGDALPWETFVSASVEPMLSAD